MTRPPHGSGPLLFFAFLLCCSDLRSQQQPAQSAPSAPPVVATPAVVQPSASGPVQTFVPGDIKTSDIHTGTGPSSAGASQLPPPSPAGRPVLGLALEGGGALGLAHIGVLKWMDENRIPVDRISGTSMGCLVSALYASGKTPQEMEQLTESDVFARVLTCVPRIATPASAASRINSNCPRR